MSQKQTQKNVYKTTVTVAGRMHYNALFEPKSFEDDDDAKYNITLIIPKDSKEVDKITGAIKEAKRRAIDKGIASKAKLDSGWQPLRDGDEEREGEEYKGMYYINAKANPKNKPSILKPAKVGNSIIYQEATEDDMYAGCEVAVEMSFWGFSKMSTGIGVSFSKVLKLKDGDPLFVTTTNEEAFGEFTSEFELEGFSSADDVKTPFDDGVSPSGFMEDYDPFK